MECAIFCQLSSRVLASSLTGYPVLFQALKFPPKRLSFFPNSPVALSTKTHQSMMNKLIVLGAISLAAAFVALAIDLDPTYFVSPPLEPWNHPTYQKLLEAIADISDDAKTTADVRKSLKKLVNGGKSEWKKRMHVQLLDMAEPTDDILPGQTRYYLMTRYLGHQLEDKKPDDPRLPKVRLMLDYLDKFAETKFKLYLEAIKPSLGRIMGRVLKEEAGLDKFVNTSYHMEAPYGTDDQELFEVARNLDFADKKLRLKRPMKFIEKKSGERKSEHWVKYLNEFCTPLRHQMNTANGYFDLYNIVRAFGGEEADDVPIKFKKLNEYHRICLSLTNRATRAQTLGVIAERLDKLGGIGGIA